MRVPMIATKDLTYATRRLKADDQFDASRNDARVLTALGRARLIEEPVQEPVDERVALRESYETKFGKRPYMGWDADTLREKIAASGSEA